ncbi:HopJ type III effector protein [Reinekea sp.]|jgi:hypothetical protein|uniref:HopJ type III effector protein n=1 Tax=Reinekea sp. TaxID=1970455 RepID=UPI002A7F20B4|nr:HopJ type III effector protein [Reinekea sp.]
MNSLQQLLAAVYEQPESLVFDQVLNAINAEFDFSPTAFSNGELRNSAEQNQGSCQVLSFAHQAGLSQTHTLSLFAEHYRAVLADPGGSNHANIRQFIQRGWRGVSFAQTPLTKRLTGAGV